MSRTLYVIDGHAQIYRSYYAPFRPLTSPSGEPTKATYVFCTTLFNLIKSCKPDYLVMTLDVSDSTVFRVDLFPEYKANREPPPEDLPVQHDRIIQIVSALGIPIFSKEGFEADDLMATIARQVRDEDLDTYLVSKDKDLEQLITDHLFLYDVGKGERIDRDVLLERKGYAPEQVIDIQTLTGDNVDNIPGVPGIGPKTAAKLINKYGSAQAVLDHVSELTPKQRENVAAFAEQMPITRQLVTLDDNVDFPFDLEACKFDRLQVDTVLPLFSELGFNSLAEQLRHPALAGEFALSNDAAGERMVSTASGQVSQTDSSTEDRSSLFAPPVVEGAYELVDTVEKLTELVGRMKGVKRFAIDTETTSLNVIDAHLVGIALAWEAGTAYYLPTRSALGEVLPMEAVRKLLGPILANPSVAKVGQNIKYDWVILLQADLPLAGVTFDTMIASFLLEPLRRSRSLDGLALDLLGHTMIPITDLIGKGRDQITIDEVDPARVCTYAGEDADITWQIAEILAARMASHSTRSLFVDTEMPLVEVLTTMERHGIALDAKVLERMSDELSDRLDELRIQVHDHAGHTFNVDSPKQLAVVLYDEQELPVLKRTRTSRSTDAETLERLAGQSDHPIPRLMIEYRELSKLKGTYLDTLPKMVSRTTGRLHTHFHQTGAVTGRLSSSDPNLQNIPVRTEIGRRIREAFIAPDEGHRLVVADYSQIELRILAHYSQDSALLAAFRAGEDIHRTVAAQVNGIDPGDVSSEQRSAAKAVNFGLIYGQSAFGLARNLGITRTDAQSFIDRYYERFSGVKAFIDQCIEDARTKGYAETMLGRQRPIDELNSRNKQQVALGERIAINTVIQGTAADLIKRAMIDIHRMIESRSLPLRMLVQVHDELVFETPTEHVDDHVELVRSAMSDAMVFDVPIVVDVGVGTNWLAAK